MESIQESKNIERKIFFRNAREFIDEMRLLFRDAKLSKKEGDWNNVIDHSLMQVEAVSVLSDKLNLDPKEKTSLMQAVLLHDWNKRLEIRKKDFTGEEIEEANRKFAELGVDESLIEATHPGFSGQILNGSTTFAQRIMFYVDDITKGSEISKAKDRLDEVEARRQDLNEDSEWTEKLGKKYWDSEREAVSAVET